MDIQPRDQQLGYLKDQPRTDQIVTLWIIVEQSAEWKTPNSLIRRKDLTVCVGNLIKSASTLWGIYKDHQYHIELQR